MNCAQFQRAWMEHWDGESVQPADRTKALTAHRESCPACEREIHALERLRASLQADPEPRAPPDLAARALAQCIVAPPPRTPHRGWLGWVAAVVLASLVLGCLLVALQLPSQQRAVSLGVLRAGPVQMDIREARALATVGRAAHRAERARMRAASAVGRAIRLGRLGQLRMKEEL